LQIHWDLKGDTTILSNQTLTIPSGTVLNIGFEILNNNNNGPYIFTNDGTIYNNGTILLFPFKYTRYDGEYNDFINNGNIIGEECISAFDYNNNFPVISFSNQLNSLNFDDRIINFSITNVDVKINWNTIQNSNIIVKNYCIYVSNSIIDDINTFDKNKIIKYSNTTTSATISILNNQLPYYIWMGVEITTGQMWSQNYRKLTFPVENLDSKVQMNTTGDVRAYLTWNIPYNLRIEDFQLNSFYVDMSINPDFNTVTRNEFKKFNDNEFRILDSSGNILDRIQVVIDINNNIKTAYYTYLYLNASVIYYFKIGVPYKDIVISSNVSQGSWIKYMSLLPNNFPNADNNYAQRANGIFYLTPGREVSVERDIGSRGWILTLLRPIQIYRDISWSGTWGGSLILTIDMNWNIRLQFKTTDGWRQNNQTIFTHMSIDRDNNNAKETKYSSGVKKVSHNIVKYSYGEQRGGGYSEIEGQKLYKMVGGLFGISLEPHLEFVGFDPNLSISLVSNYSGNISGSTPLEVRNLAQFIHFNAEFVGYYDGYPRRDIAGGDMVIKVFNTIGLRMPTIDMSFKQLLSQSYTYYEINHDINHTTMDYITQYSPQMILIDIAECVNIEQKSDGTFTIKLIRPIKITISMKFKYNDGNDADHEFTYTVETYIGTPNSLTWRIDTHLKGSGYLSVLIHPQQEKEYYIRTGFKQRIFSNLHNFDQINITTTNSLIDKNERIFSLPTFVAEFSDDNSIEVDSMVVSTGRQHERPNTEINIFSKTLESKTLILSETNIINCISLQDIIRIDNEIATFKQVKSASFHLYPRYDPRSFGPILFNQPLSMKTISINCSEYPNI
jgi:hypothetical protein